ncbi:hypothetical protein FC54_GL001023 [Ligilactobacillus saerimneri DSM 16049]|nr:hypothetical protein FC54_GL001023 [Ligilactobacillus saerimneri DSM 16049]
MLGFNELKKLLSSYSQPEVVFEATGVYSRRLQRFLIDNNYQFVCLNPLRERLN